MKRSLLCFFIFFQFSICSAQEKLEFPADLYRTSENPLYWKHRMPFPGYWQQDVHYTLRAELDDQKNTITGTEKLIYYNNSPDTLKELFFHLYQNSFQPGSYMDDQYKANKSGTSYGKYEEQGLGTTINNVRINGEAGGKIIDYSIMRIPLKKPLLPNEKLTIEMSFVTYFDNGGVRRRMKMFKHDGVTQYDGVHWYPRISVYDRKFGWTTDQHLGREFYGDYGTYDVALTLPSQYILDGTGTLQNRYEVMPDDLRQKLDIKNFATRRKDGKLTDIIPIDGSKKTWKFHAENVHDFSWVADPSFRIGETEWNGIKCIALAQEPVAPRWQNAADYTAKIIRTYSTDIGMYAWPKIIVADARDGMEYPMLTLCGGMDPDYRSLFAHEVGHEWFFGMVGNNETYRAMLDEGFTQFLTVWCLNRIDGPYKVAYPPRSSWIRRFREEQTVREEQLIQPYIRNAVSGEQATLNTHSDYFNGALGHGGGYGMVYYKTGTMLYNLQYVLGDSLFLKAMQHYFSQWKICHPYPEDFRNSIIQFTHMDLNWFFDEWIETTKTIDYAVKDVSKEDSAGKYAITFQRLGRMQMPVDFTVLTKEGKKYNFYIPNTWFAKTTNATTLPKWEGWDNVRPEYTAHIKIDGKIKDVIIDTSLRLADVNLLNNSWKPPVKWRFDSQVYNATDRAKTTIYWRPDIWYNTVDGPKIGLHLEKEFPYLGQDELTIWGQNPNQWGDKRFRTADASRDYIQFNLLGSGTRNGYNSSLNLRLLDGLRLGKFAVNKTFDHNITLSFSLKAMVRPRTADLDYLLYPTEWQADKWNNTLNFGISHSYSGYHSSGTNALTMRTTTLFSDYSYSTLTAQWYHYINLWKLRLRGRWIASYSTGLSIAPESQLYLAGANPEDLMENKFTRSRAFVPEEWLGYGKSINHFQQGGGLNLRGYAGYLAPVSQDNHDFSYAGTAGTAINLELDFDRMIKFNPKWFSRFFILNTYLFTDAGTINYNGLSNTTLKLSDLRMDAGIGTALTIKSWGALQRVHPLTIRFDMPLFLNAAPFEEHDNFKWRWVMGVGRTF